MSRFYYGTDHIFTDRTKRENNINVRGGLNDYLNFVNISINDLVHYVDSINGFPDPVGDVITLEDEHSYIIIGDLDLLGNRIVCGTNNVIDGISSENSSLTSTGLSPTTALITSNYTILFRNLTIQNVGTLFNLDALGNSGAIDWLAFNIQSVPTIGIIKDYDNMIVNDCAWINSSDLTLTGTFGTIGFTNSLLTNSRNTTTLTLDSSCIITRRFKGLESSFVITGTGSFIDIDGSTVPNQGIIFTGCNFSGGTSAGYILNIDESSNQALFTRNVGIINSRSVGSFYVSSSSATTVATAGVWYKVAGTTTASALNSKFTHTDNKLTYTGNLATIFNYTFGASINGTNANIISMGISKNGADPDAETIIDQTVDSGGKIGFQGNSGVIQLSNGDYIEVWGRNNSAIANFTAVQLSVNLTSNIG